MRNAFGFTGFGFPRSGLGLIYGPELVVNGTFNTDITGWSNFAGLPPTSMVWDAAGRLRITNTGATRGLTGAAAGIPVTAGAKYAYSLTMIVTTGDGPAVSLNQFAYNASRQIISAGGAPATYNLSGTFTSTLTESIHFVMDFNADAVSRDVSFDNISLRQVT
jgi:hypothetical protein